MAQSSPPSTPAAPDTPWARGRVLGVWLQVAGACCIIGVVLTSAGAFGTSALQILPRLLYWLAMMVVGASVGVTVARFAIPESWFRRRWYLVMLPIALGTAVPMSLITALADSLVTHHRFRLAHITEVFPTTLITTTAITALAFLIRRRPPVATHAAPAGAPAAKFLSRLPDRLKGAELWAVEAEDHYLRLHTSLGQDLILMRLSDALAELEGIEGAQTHRSWWVAKAAVVEAERADGRATLTLKDRAKAPVSRSFLPLLRDEGWFDS
ncbi:LytTR family DNA-binding domain-containing protein [Caulobacter sp. KR2-114]|uniref:LytTR family DNA-binding domain-containing protein n=1 Tax=Caulobacter sp. KR2-114 TaxID=3400912 RepID=UPI003C0F45C5